MNRLLKISLLLVFVAALATPLKAATTWNWVGGDTSNPPTNLQDFNDIANWTGGSGAFANGDTVVVNGIDDTGNYPILSTSPTVSFGSIQVGNGGAGYMSQTGGNVTSTGDFGVGNQGAAGASTYSMSGGTLTETGGTAYIGFGTGETGIVNLSGTAQMSLNSGLVWIGRSAPAAVRKHAAAGNRWRLGQPHHGRHHDHRKWRRR